MTELDNVTREVELMALRMLDPWLKEEYAGWSLTPILAINTEKPNQKRYGDIQANQRGAQPEYIEVKGVHGLFPNMAVELIQSCRTGDPGWFYSLVFATRLIWVYVDTGTAYDLEYQPWKQAVGQKLDTPPVLWPIRFNREDARRQSNGLALNVLVPWSWMIDLGVCRRFELAPDKAPPQGELGL